MSVETRSDGAAPASRDAVTDGSDPSGSSPGHGPRPVDPATGAVYRRVLHRETHVSRSVAASVATVVLLLLVAVVVVAAVFVLLDQRPWGVDARAAVDAAVRAPDGLPAAVVVGVGALVALVGLAFLLQGLLPRRRPRHTMRSDRLAVVIDDEVLASAAARAARTATRLGPDGAVGTVGRHVVEVVLRPAAGVDVPSVAATEAVEREIVAVDASPAVTPRVRVQPTGKVDG